MNWKGFDSIMELYRYLTEENEENHESTSVRMTSIPAEVRIQVNSLNSSPTCSLRSKNFRHFVVWGGPASRRWANTHFYSFHFTEPVSQPWNYSLLPWISPSSLFALIVSTRNTRPLFTGFITNDLRVHTNYVIKSGIHIDESVFYASLEIESVS
jgi:hypothetical protein